MSKMFNRARMSISSTGTGTLTLNAGVLGYQSFAQAGIANGDVVSYTIEDGANWEVGTGTYTAAGTTLSRTVTQSYNGTTYGTSPISVTTSAQVFITILAADVVAVGGALGTPSSITLTNGTGLPLTTGVTGTLPVANGGTGVTTSTGSGSVVLSTSPTLVTPALGTPASGNLANCTFPTLNQDTTGTAAGLSTTLAVTSGGTGVTTSTGTGSVVLSTSPTLVTPLLGTPTSGNFSTGTFTWPTFNQNTTGTASNITGTLAVLQGGTGATATTGTGNNVLATGPTLVTPILGTPTSGTLTNCTGYTVANLASAGTGVVTALGNATNATGGVTTVDGTATLTNKTLTNPTVTNYTETAYSIGNSSTAVTISLANGTVQTVTMTGNCTFTMPTAAAGKSFVLIVSSGAGSFTGTFTSVKWPSNTAPTLTTTATRWDILSFFSDGTNWYGSFVQAFQ